MLGQKERFIAWVEQQDPAGAYDYGDAENCAFAQFEKAEGSWHGPRCAYGASALPQWAKRALNGECVADDEAAYDTYGALLQRLRGEA